MEPKFITGKPALVAGDTLVIADLHVGVEYEYFKSGIKIPSNTQSMQKETEKLIRMTKANKLVILGDVKHKVPGITKQEMREVPAFLQNLSEIADVHVIPGNHDGGLKDSIPKNVRLRSSSGFGTKDCYFLHGHTWPSSDFLEKKYVFVGHEHPQIEFRDKLGYRFFESVWVQAKLNRAKLGEKYKLPKRLPELIILPRFNSLSGGIAMNRPVSDIEKAHSSYHSGMGTLVRHSRTSSSGIYLLDGTYLGKLSSLF